MKQILFGILSLLLFSLPTFAQTYTGPVPKPATGYGSDGIFAVSIQTFPNPNFPTKDIEIYYPSGITSSVPTIFYSHAYGGNDPSNISGFLNFVAKKGYAVVFVPYQTFGVSVADRYDNLLEGFIKAARDYTSIIDTSNVGFVGHSFGGGASFANAHECFTSLNWGGASRFIFTMAQWYSYSITQTELQSFPNDVKLLSIVYENDQTNDHRMTNDIFNNINIPTTEKDYLLVKPSSVSGYDYIADHVVPNNSNFDALDYYAYYRLLDAMCDYVFNGNVEAKDVALGDGSPNQLTMPSGMVDLVHSDAPTFSNSPNTYTFPCDTILNPRQSYCNTTLAISELENPSIEIFPNPTKDYLNIVSQHPINKIQIMNYLGQVIKTTEHKKINLNNLKSGVYIVKVCFEDNTVIVKKIVKE